MLFHRALSGARAALLAALAGAALLVAPTAHAATPFVWKGHTWKVTSGAMAGVADGSPNNVSIDGSGYLHLKITSTAGTWTASELFTTDDLGFGTYQWQVDGPIDVYDKNVVLGLFPYGPAGGIGKDGTNEIDIEFSRWGQASGPNADWTDYPSSGTTQGEMSFSFSLGGGTLSTSRFVWTSTSIEDFLMTGIQPIGSTTGLVKSWTYAPANAMVNIPQQAMPLGINLWCFAIPSDAKDEEVVIRDFEFVPEGTAIPDAGAEAGASAGADGSAGVDAGASAGASGDSDAGVGPSADSDAGVSAGSACSASDSGASVPSSPEDTPAPSSSGCSCTVARTGTPAEGALLFLSTALVAVRRRRSRAERAYRARPISVALGTSMSLPVSSGSSARSDGKRCQASAVHRRRACTAPAPSSTSSLAVPSRAKRSKKSGSGRCGLGRPGRAPGTPPWPGDRATTRGAPVRVPAPLYAALRLRDAHGGRAPGPPGRGPGSRDHRATVVGLPPGFTPIGRRPRPVLLRGEPQIVVVSAPFYLGEWVRERRSLRVSSP